MKFLFLLIGLAVFAISGVICHYAYKAFESENKKYSFLLSIVGLIMICLSVALVIFATVLFF